MEAADLCTDPILRLAMHLSFSCSLRIGEILTLRWENVHISESDYEQQMLRLDAGGGVEKQNQALKWSSYSSWQWRVRFDQE